MKITIVWDLRDRGGELAQGLAHQPRLQARLAVAHLAIDFGARRQRRNGIDDEHVDRAGADQSIGDFKRLLACIGLGDQQLVEIDAKLAGIDGIERMFGVDEGTDAAQLLRFGDDMQRQRRLAGGFRAINLDHPATRQTADAKRDIEPERPRRNGLDFNRRALAEAHDRALAEGALDLGYGSVERLGLVHGCSFHKAEIRLAHRIFPSDMGARTSAMPIAEQTALLPRRSQCTLFVLTSKFFFCSLRSC